MNASALHHPSPVCSANALQPVRLRPTPSHPTPPSRVCAVGGAAQGVPADERERTAPAQPPHLPTHVAPAAALDLGHDPQRCLQVRWDGKVKAVNMGEGGGSMPVYAHCCSGPEARSAALPSGGGRQGRCCGVWEQGRGKSDQHFCPRSPCYCYRSGLQAGMHPPPFALSPPASSPPPRCPPLPPQPPASFAPWRHCQVPGLTLALQHPPPSPSPMRQPSPFPHPLTTAMPLTTALQKCVAGVARGR